LYFFIIYVPNPTNTDPPKADNKVKKIISFRESNLFLINVIKFINPIKKYMKAEVDDDTVG